MNWMIAQMPFPEHPYEAKTDYAFPADIEYQIHNTNIENAILKDLGIGNKIYQENINLLEIGFGFSGFLINTAIRGKGSYVGIEPYSESFNFAKSKIKELGLKNINIQNYFIEEYYLGEKRYDFVCMFHILEHTKNPINALTGVYPSLKPNGKLIVVTPNAEGYFAKKSLEKWRHSGPNHFWLPGKNTLISLLKSCNYKIEKYFTYSGFPAPRNIFGEVGNRLLKLLGLGDAIAILCKK